MATVTVYLQSEFPSKEKLYSLPKKFRDSVSLKLDIGKILKSLTQETFEKQADPWGNPWKPSKRVTGEINNYSLQKLSNYFYPFRVKKISGYR
jgi:hypothetical protein